MTTLTDYDYLDYYTILPTAAAADTAAINNENN